MRKDIRGESGCFLNKHELALVVGATLHAVPNDYKQFKSLAKRAGGKVHEIAEKISKCAFDMAHMVDLLETTQHYLNPESPNIANNWLKVVAEILDADILSGVSILDMIYSNEGSLESILIEYENEMNLLGDNFSRFYSLESLKESIESSRVFRKVS